MHKENMMGIKARISLTLISLIFVTVTVIVIFSYRKSTFTT